MVIGVVIQHESQNTLAIEMLSAQDWGNVVFTNDQAKNDNYNDYGNYANVLNHD